MRYRQENIEEDGWSRPIFPEMGGYKMACCDCNLVHNLKFAVVKVVKFNKNGSFAVKELKGKRYKVVFKAQRNERATAAKRRKRD